MASVQQHPTAYAEEPAAAQAPGATEEQAVPTAEEAVVEEMMPTLEHEMTDAQVLATPSPLLCVPRGVPSAVIGSAWGLFDTLDTNGDGVVDRMEFEAGITALRPLEMTSLPPLPSELSLKSLNGHVESSTGV